MIRKKIVVENILKKSVSSGRKTFPPISTTTLTVDATALAEISAYDGLKVKIVSVFCPYCGQELSARSKKGLASHINQKHKDMKEVEAGKSQKKVVTESDGRDL